MRVSEFAEDTLFLALPARLAKKLLHLADRYGVDEGETVRIDLRLSQGELADLVGTTRERSFPPTCSRLMPRSSGVWAAAIRASKASASSPSLRMKLKYNSQLRPFAPMWPSFSAWLWVCRCCPLPPLVEGETCLAPAGICSWATE